jgi:hypothetical protein
VIFRSDSNAEDLEGCEYKSEACTTTADSATGNQHQPRSRGRGPGLMSSGAGARRQARHDQPNSALCRKCTAAYTGQRLPDQVGGAFSRRFAGAGLFDSVTARPLESLQLDATADPLLTDAAFQQVRCCFCSGQTLIFWMQRHGGPAADRRRLSAGALCSSGRPLEDLPVRSSNQGAHAGSIDRDQACRCQKAAACAGMSQRR